MIYFKAPHILSYEYLYEWRSLKQKPETCSINNNMHISLVWNIKSENVNLSDLSQQKLMTLKALIN